tara:strand:+ start:1156 stop:2154 length:999 start_codon:yes stop_codon:yes gene_type:complete
MACTGSTIKIPIDIDKTKMKKYQKSSNLTKFTYDFKNISEIDIASSYNGIIKIPIIQRAVAHISTLGRLDLVKTFFYMKSINKYNGKKMDMEILLIFENKNNKYLCMFIPVEKSDVESLTTKWFGQIADNITTVNQTIRVPNFNFNDIIPRDSFITYKSTIPYIGNCSQYFKCIFFGNAINIKSDDYDKLIKVYSETNTEKDISERGFTENSIRYAGNINNYNKFNNIFEKYVFLNEKGTKDGPGLGGTNDTLPLICTPVEDEKGDPLYGTRMDWIKGTFGGIDSETKNIFYLIVIVAVIIGAMVFIHSFIFKNLGKLIGDDTIVTRSSSLI